MRLRSDRPGRRVGLTLSLLTPDLAVLDAALEGDEALGRVLDVKVAEGWNGFPDALRRTRDSVAERPGRVEWGTRFFLAREPPTLVGWGGFKGPPAAGMVEIGYEIAPGWRGRGLATEAAGLLVAAAFDDPTVTDVIAHTLPERNASVRVLEKLGFARDGEIEDDEHVGAAWRHLRRR
jgi:[ribosomal protein S5]-alanine N-acetyltransferase